MEPMQPRAERERRRRRGGWLWMLLLLLLAIAIAAIVAATRGDGDSKSAGGVKGATASISSRGRLRAGSTNVLDASGNGSLASLVGRHVTATGVPVTSVVGDEVFWVGSGSNRVLVHLTHTMGESAPTVRSGDRVSFTGSLAANGRQDTGIFGITKSEDSALYKRQKVHVETKVSTLKVTS